MITPVRIRWGVRIPLRDGTRLSAALYLPPINCGPAPALLALTPYTVHRNHARASYFAANGYPFLNVDVRGRGNSEGTFRPFIQEAKDGHDVVEWVAAQPFCDGKVAMFSGSYEGYAQWATAKEFPPHLAAIAPGMAAAPGVDFPMRNNITYPYVLQWLALVAGRTGQDRIFEDQAFWQHNFREWYESGRPFSELDSILGMKSETLHEWLAHPSRSEYWDSYLPAAKEYARLKLPILSMTGIYDADQPGALHHYREHNRNAPPEAAARHFLVIGPWDHRGTLAPKREIGKLDVGEAAVIDVLKLHLDWYDWTLRRGPRPEFLRGRVCYYVPGADEWRHAGSLDAVTAERRAFYLDSNGTASRIATAGSLGEASGAGAADSYVYDPRDREAAKLEASMDASTMLRPIFPTNDPTDTTILDANDGKQLVYDSTPFGCEAELGGFFRLKAWISIDQPDTDFCVSVYEVLEDGRHVFLTGDIQRARYRESQRHENLIETKEPLEYDFDSFTFTARRLSRLSRLRLVIGPINSIFYQRNFNAGGIVAAESIAEARPVAVKLFHDRTHPSALHVPFARA